MIEKALEKNAYVAAHGVSSRSSIGEKEGVELELNRCSIGLARRAELEVNNCIWADVEDFEGRAAVGDGAVGGDEVGAGDGRDGGQFTVDWVSDCGRNGARILMN